TVSSSTLEQLNDDLLAVRFTYPSPEFSAINNSFSSDFSAANFNFSPDFPTIDDSISPDLERLLASQGTHPSYSPFQTEEQSINTDSQESANFWKLQFPVENLLSVDATAFTTNISEAGDELPISNETLDAFGICEYQY
ncbi:6833_t:CDS:1, partial [Acaulospora morrowiae]